MEIKYRWSKTDLEAYADFVARRAYASRKRWIRIYRFAAGAFFCLGAIISAAMQEWIPCVLLAVFALLYTVMFKRFTIRAWRHNIARQQQAIKTDVFCDREMAIDDNKIFFQSPDTTTSLTFDAVEKLEDAGPVFLLALKRGDYALIPKSAFGTQREEQEFYNLIASKV